MTIEIFKERASLISIIRDDGFGFDAAILKSLGEPYVSTRQPTPGRDGGMGLGIFIAKTLLESAGARILFSNVENGRRAGGACVEIEWPLDQFEATNV